MAWRVARRSFLFLLAAALVASVQAQEPEPDSTGASSVPPATSDAPANPTVDAQRADEEAIRAASRAFVAAFDANDSKELAESWTRDGAYVDETGTLYDGLEAIEQEYRKFFAENPGVKLRLFIDSIRMLSDSAAIEDGRAFVDSPSGASPAYGKYVAIHVKVDGRWLMSMVRDTRVEVASSYANVADLEWLVGEWAAEENGARSQSVCRWIANKSFVERKYAMTQADGTTTAGVQIIGWNPAELRMQSWNFSSDGGHAVGVWSPAENGWSATVEGMTGAGVPTRAVNHLRKLDDDAYVWSSTDRTLGGEPLPDAEEVVMKRVPAAP